MNANDVTEFFQNYLISYVTYAYLGNWAAYIVDHKLYEKKTNKLVKISILLFLHNTT